VSGWMGPTALTGTASVANGSESVSFSMPQTLSAGAALTFDSSGAVYFLQSNVLAGSSGTLTVAYQGATNATATATQLGLADMNTANPGTLIETDTHYRLRQVEDLGELGSCNLAAIAVDIENALLAAPQTVIAYVTPYENTTDYIDANGLLPHSYQVVVFDGRQPNLAQNNPIIAQSIWANKPAGLRPYGTTSVTTLDSQGVQRVVTFTRPTPLPVYMVVNVQIASTANAAQVTSLITTAIIDASQGDQFTAYGATVVPNPGSPVILNPGTDVVPGAYEGVAQAQAGVVQVTSVLVGFAANPTAQNVLQVQRGFIAVLAGGPQMIINCTVFTP
jgi:hypothetical protein